MDIYDYLKKDHQKVAGLMERLGSSTDDKERIRVFKELSSELTLHADTEEETFYRALIEKGGKQLQEKEKHAEEEHAEIRKYLKECASQDCGSKGWMVSFGELRHAVEHHVDEEEGAIFEKARNVISDREAEKLAKDMEALKQQQMKKNRAA